MAARVTVGLIGLGRMGRPMAERVLDAGFALTVHNRSRAAVDALVAAGATDGGSTAGVAARAEVVLTCLPTLDASEQVYLGAGGLVGAGRAGQTFVELSTVGPPLVRAIAAAGAERGIAVLDAPVSGGPEGAREGTLTIMAGGDPLELARVEPVLRAFGRTIRHMGPIGSGSVAKLVNQALTAIHAASAAEALVLGTAAGADPVRLLEVLSSSFGQSRVLERSGPRILARAFDDAAPVRLLRKDLTLVEALGEQYGVELSLTRAADRLCGRAEAMGLADSDFAALVRPLEAAAGVTVGGPETGPPGGAHPRRAPTD
ncbi:MAG: NAD(P)-dependent oxidoreductase [Acidobacteriota bacterium]|nr:NAD(P)-dependent oxidoreductase [Acidobacteriota bacterium]